MKVRFLVLLVLIGVRAGREVRAVFDRSLLIQPPDRDSGAHGRFGQSVCISADGDIFVVGSSSPLVSPENGGWTSVGFVYEQSLDAAKEHSGDWWIRSQLQLQNEGGVSPTGQEKVGNVGFACAISPIGHLIALTSPGQALSRRKGFLVIFERESNGKWVHRQSIEPTEQREADAFGWSIAASSGFQEIFIGSKGSNANNGELIVFGCDEKFTLCQELQRLAPPDHTDQVGSGGIRIKNNFGMSVACSADGAILAVGSPGYQAERGAAYLYKRRGRGNWRLVQRLEATIPKPAAFFGFKISIDQSAMYIVVGADGEDDMRGATYIFKSERMDQWHAQQRIVLGARKKEDNFGGAVAMAGEGAFVIIGAPGASADGAGRDAGKSFVYQRTEMGSWDLVKVSSKPNASDLDFFGWAVAISAAGTTTVSSAPNSFAKSGCVVVERTTSFTRPRPEISESLAHDDVVSLWKDDETDL